MSVLAQKAGVAVTLIHHDNKADGRAVEDKARGSTAISAAVDQILHIERRWPKDDPDARELVAWGRVRESDWTNVIRLDLATSTYSVGEPPAEEAAAANQRADLDVVRQLGTATYETFAEAVGKDKKTAERRLKGLLDRAGRRGQRRPQDGLRRQLGHRHIPIEQHGVRVHPGGR